MMNMKTKTPTERLPSFARQWEPGSSRINVEPQNIEQGLVKLVLSVIELLRQLLERQALRRMDAGSLSEEEIERLGAALMRLEDKVRELQRQFDIDDLDINLGPLGRLLND